MSTELAARLVKALTTRGETMATAESCTGGLISGAVTAVPGSSAVLWGGIVSYANDAKVGLLDVDPAVLAEKGAVSSEVASLMAWGARTVSGADWTVSVTGIAGPDGGTDEKPVGTVWIGWCDPRGSVETRSFLFPGDRDAVRSGTVNEALKGLISRIESASA